jgi:hypothetical protein
LRTPRVKLNLFNQSNWLGELGGEAGRRRKLPGTGATPPASFIALFAPFPLPASCHARLPSFPRFPSLFPPSPPCDAARGVLDGPNAEFPGCVPMAADYLKSSAAGSASAGVPGGQLRPLSRFCDLSAFPLSLPPHPWNCFGQRSELSSDPLRGVKSGGSFIDFEFFGLAS